MTHVYITIMRVAVAGWGAGVMCWGATIPTTLLTGNDSPWTKGFLQAGGYTTIGAMLLGSGTMIVFTLLGYPADLSFLRF